MIRLCDENDFKSIYEVINDGAQAYRGVIPNELWREPFVSRDYLQSEIESGVRFKGFEQNNSLLAVMGTQEMDDVVLIRHSYVRTAYRRNGLGSKLLSNHLSEARLPVLVGCLKTMTWAISFYEKHGFSVVSDKLRDELRARYWSLPEAHVRQSVVLVDKQWRKQNSEVMGA